MDPTHDDSDRPRSRGVLSSLLDSIFFEVKEQTKRVFTDDIPQSIGLTGRSEITSGEEIAPITSAPASSREQASQNHPEEMTDQTDSERNSSSDKQENEYSKKDLRSDSDSPGKQKSSSDRSGRDFDSSRRDTSSPVYISSDRQRQLDARKNSSGSQRHTSETNRVPSDQGTRYDSTSEPVITGKELFSSSSSDNNSPNPSRSGTLEPHRVLYTSRSQTDTQNPASSAFPTEPTKITLPDYRSEIPLLHPPRPTDIAFSITKYLLTNSKMDPTTLSLPPEKQILLILDKIRVEEKLPDSVDTMGFLQSLAPKLV